MKRKMTQEENLINSIVNLYYGEDEFGNPLCKGMFQVIHQYKKNALKEAADRICMICDLDKATCDKQGFACQFREAVLYQPKG